MGLNEVTNFSEIAAAIATIITLVYLAIQIRSNTVVQKAEARRAIQAITSDYSSIIGESKEVARVFRVGLTDFDKLDEDEKMQFFFLFAMLVGLADQTYADYCLKIIDTELLEAGNSSVFRMLRTPGGRMFWQVNSASYTQSFQKYVEERVFHEDS